MTAPHRELVSYPLGTAGVEENGERSGEMRERTGEEEAEKEENGEIGRGKGDKSRRKGREIKRIRMSLRVFEGQSYSY